jgi:hypothetical protein
MKYRFGPWKKQTKIYKVKGTWEKDEHKIREFDVDSNFKVMESIETRSRDKDSDGIYRDRTSQSNYHFLGLINKDKDILWVQGNMSKDSQYAVYGKNTSVILTYGNEKKAFEKLRQKFKKRGIEIDDSNTGKQNLVYHHINCYTIGKDFIDCEVNKQIRFGNDSYGRMNINKPVDKMSIYTGDLIKMPLKFVSNSWDGLNFNDEDKTYMRIKWSGINLDGVRIK